MGLGTFLWYVAAIAVVIIIPGPLSLLTVNNALRYGIVRSIPGFLGGVSASILLLTTSAVGVGALVLASPRVFSAMQLAGAAYLIYLGIRTWRQADASRLAEASADTTPPRFLPLFRQAFLLGASNPKDIAFFVAFLPQFVAAKAPMAPQLAVMVAAWVAVDLLCKLLYAAGAPPGGCRRGALPGGVRFRALGGSGRRRVGGGGPAGHAAVRGGRDRRGVPDGRNPRAVPEAVVRVLCLRRSGDLRSPLNDQE